MALPAIVPGFRLVRLCTERLAVARLFDKQGVTAADGSGEMFLAFAILGRIAGLEPRSITIVATSEPDFNAASAGRGRFIVTRGFTEATRSVTWGVVAHEIAHDHLGHVGQVLALETGWTVFDCLVGGLAGALGSRGFRLAERSFEQSQEYDADDHAVELLRRAGRPPGLLRYALELLLQTYGETGGGWFATHPSTADRIDRLPALEATEVP